MHDAVARTMRYSSDGRYYWNGHRWVPTEAQPLRRPDSADQVVEVKRQHVFVLPAWMILVFAGLAAWVAIHYML